jgi:hypothetical protein
MDTGNITHAPSSLNNIALLGGFLMVGALGMIGLRAANAPPMLYSKSAAFLATASGSIAALTRNAASAIIAAAGALLGLAIESGWNFGIPKRASIGFISAWAAFIIYLALGGLAIAQLTLSTLGAKEVIAASMAFFMGLGAYLMPDAWQNSFKLGVPLLITGSAFMSAMTLVYHAILLRPTLKPEMERWEKVVGLIMGAIGAIGIIGAIVLYGANALATLIGSRGVTLFYYILICLAGIILINYNPTVGKVVFVGAAIGIAYIILPQIYAWVRNYYFQNGRQIIKHPLTIGAPKNISTYTELNGGEDPTYTYSISFWLFLDSFPLNTGIGYAGDATIMSYGDTLKVVYNALNSELGIMVGDRRVIRYTDPPLQRWNQIVLTCYDGHLDFFCNGELIQSVHRVLPFITLDTLVVGCDGGIHGQVANMVYYRSPLAPNMVQYNYLALRNTNPPLPGNILW